MANARLGNTRHLVLFLAPAILLVASGWNTFASAKDQTGTPQQIEITLTPKTKTVRIGEALDLRVEIKNVGKTELVIEKSIYEYCGHSPLSFYLDNGPPLSPHAQGGGCAADCVTNPKDTFTNKFAKHWIALPAGHFYGAVVRLDPRLFPELQTPGHWKLHGRYISAGDLSSSFCMNFGPKGSEAEQTERLPYDGWKGEEDTNTVQVDVVRARRFANQKQP